LKWRELLQGKEANFLSLKQDYVRREAEIGG